MNIPGTSGESLKILVSCFFLSKYNNRVVYIEMLAHMHILIFLTLILKRAFAHLSVLIVFYVRKDLEYNYFLLKLSSILQRRE